MIYRYLRMTGFFLLLVCAGGTLALGGVWVAHDCCGHPSDSCSTDDSGTNETSNDDCVCACCQAETAIFPLPLVSFRPDSWWSVESVSDFAVSRFETDIFRPPLA